jgi:hypothetical protein
VPAWQVQSLEFEPQYFQNNLNGEDEIDQFLENNSLKQKK